MKAKDKFTEGQRIKMSKEALDKGLDGYKAKRRTGVVKGFPLSEKYQEPDVLVKVLRNGERVARTYHMDFWEPDDEA